MKTWWSLLVVLAIVTMALSSCSPKRRDALARSSDTQRVDASENGTAQDVEQGKVAAHKRGQNAPVDGNVVHPSESDSAPSPSARRNEESETEKRAPQEDGSDA